MSLSCKQPVLLTVFFCLLSASLMAQNNRPFSAGLPTAVPATTYGGPSVGLLNQAYRQIRSGQIDEATMTYDAILAQQPNWLPALVGKAALLQRIGRQKEAATYQQRAYRIDPLATGFLMAKGRNALLRYLALYPEDAMPQSDMTDEEAASFSKAAYFDQQLQTILNLPDSTALAQTLQAKVAGDRSKTINLLHDLMQDQKISTDFGFMLEGNINMLNHDYLGAVAAYNQAVDFHAEDWPEITYNRGLAFILLNNYTNGCAELDSSARQGFEPAENMLRSLCSF